MCTYYLNTNTVHVHKRYTCVTSRKIAWMSNPTPVPQTIDELHANILFLEMYTLRKREGPPNTPRNRQQWQGVSERFDYCLRFNY